MYVILDARKLGEKETAHQYLKTMFSFPDYYGANLDALYDCLTEQPYLCVRLIHTEDAGAYFEKVLSVFEDAENLRICQ